LSDEDTRKDDAQPEEEPKPQGGDIIEELDKLGRDVSQGIADAWRSDERKEVQEEIEKGLGAAGKELGKVAADVNSSEAAQELKKGAKAAGRELKSGLLSGLKFLNREMGGGGSGRGGEGEGEDGGEKEDGEGGD